MSEQERAMLAYYRTPLGRNAYMMSDLAWAEYNKLLDKEEQDKETKNDRR